MYFIFVDVFWSPTCFGPSCGHLQGDFFENNNAIVMKVCQNHSAILISSPSRLQSLHCNSPSVSCYIVTLQLHVIVTSFIFIIISISFHYSTANFNQKLCFFKYCGVIQTFYL